MAVTSELLNEYLAKGISYEAYRNLIDKLQLEGRSTAVEDNEDRIQYTSLNVKRMDRVDKKVDLLNSISLRLLGLSGQYTFLLLAESWCADASQIVPVIAKIASNSYQINLKILLRDENLPLMDKFLSNGGRAIPKLIIIDREDESVVAEWGARPEEAIKMVQDYKAEYGKIDAQFKIELQKWYNKNKGVAIQEEILELLEEVEEKVLV